MKIVPINGRKSAPARTSVEELTPPPPAERYMHKIVMNVFGRRFELKSHVEVREIRRPG
jgi:hypothetical protein